MHQPLTRLTLLVAATAITSSAFTAFAGVADTRYDLQYYLDFQCEVVERRTRFDLKKAKDQLHIYEGLLLAQDNIDEVVQIIRTSKTQEDARNRLMDRFGFTEVQTKSILDMRLARLVGLEKDTIIANIERLKQEIANYEYILSSHEHVLNKVVDELLDCRSRSELRETIQSAEKMSRFFKRLKKTSYYMKV